MYGRHCYLMFALVNYSEVMNLWEVCKTESDITYQHQAIEILNKT